MGGRSEKIRANNPTPKKTPLSSAFPTVAMGTSVPLMDSFLGGHIISFANSFEVSIPKSGNEVRLLCFPGLVLSVDGSWIFDTGEMAWSLAIFSKRDRVAHIEYLFLSLGASNCVLAKMAANEGDGSFTGEVVGLLISMVFEVMDSLSG